MSCVRAAYLVRGDKLGAPDLQTSHTYFVLACGEKLQEPLACAQAAVDLLKGAVTSGDRAKDLELGRLLTRAACDAGYGFGCFNLGVVYRDGMGVPSDAALAASLFEKSCADHYAGGCVELGMDVQQRDPARAVALFEQACADEARTCFNLAIVLDDGTGTSKDPLRARALYEKSCSAEDPDPSACHNLARMMLAGRGGPRDVAGAKRLFEKACADGVANACKVMSAIGGAVSAP